MGEVFRSSGRRDFGARRDGSLDPDLMSLMNLVRASRYADVERLARRILQTRPDQPLALKALSFALLGLRRFEEVLPIVDHAISRTPDDPELHNNRGIALSSLLCRDESIESFERARRLAPEDPDLLKNLGGALIRLRRWNEAIPVLLQAIEKHPGDYVEAVELLAGALLEVDRVDEAWICFNELCAHDPDNVCAMSHLVASSLKRCHWEGLMARIATMVERGGEQVPLANPFSFLAFPGLNRDYLARVAEKFALEHIYSDATRMPVEELARIREHKERLRIGYLSADFRVHPVGLIIPEIIERHDRSRFEVFGYSTKEGDGSLLRRRLETAFDRFVELQDVNLQDVVRAIRADGIDVLIDLNGWTANGRPEALAMRCAPVQVNWLGYAGTMGHPAIADYVIGDPVATPLGHSAHFSEVIAQMPNSYFPADTTGVPAADPTRLSAGLPDSAFVFCSFNNRYKFNPPLFDLWTRLLREAPESVLWLTRPGAGEAEALRAEIRQRGIDDARLIFAERVESHAEHLARIRLADLALDTFPYNSHSTGMDTLLAGVPMVALLGETFASRVGASLLHAAGLAELVAGTPEQYVGISLDLVHDRPRLASLRQRLVDGRASLPLFDMKSFVGNLEGLYMRMWQNFLAGKREPIPAA